MSKILPFPKARRKPDWTRAKAYRRAVARVPVSKRRGGRRRGWFPVALVTLPLAAFSAVFLMPLGPGPQQAAASGASLAPPAWRGADAATLDAAQPDVAAAARTPGAGTGAGAGDREAARFGLCAGPVRVTCVVDGDTIWYEGAKIRIADINTPEVSDPDCPAEAALGRKATRRLQALLNEGPFTLEPNTFGPSEDRYGRALMVVTREGQSLGAALVAEGLAEPWTGRRREWC
jgi:endonuclease YncB( thermonuclease family)